MIETVEFSSFEFVTPICKIVSFYPDRSKNWLNIYHELGFTYLIVNYIP